MSLSSMTGFARRDGALGPLSWVWELRSVNGKGLDVRLRMPPGHDALEQPVRKAVAARLKRGSLTLSLSVTREAETAALRVNEAVLAEVLTQAVEVTGRLGVAVDPPRLDGLLHIRGVLETASEEPEDEDQRAAQEKAMLATFDEAVEALRDARREEGGRLEALLSGHLDTVEALRAQAAETESLRPEAVRARMTAQITELLEAVPDRLSEDRLAQELALLAVKADVREELDRLGAHVEGARVLLAGQEPAGRRLEFLCQELNREANTLCSKSQDVALTRIGLDLKAVIDQVREQVLNIE